MNRFAQVNSASGIPGLESCLFSVQVYVSYVCFSQCILHILSGWCEQAAPGHITHSNSHCHVQGTLPLRKTPKYWQEEEGSWASQIRSARETGISGNFVGRIKGAKCPFDLQFLTWDFS